jgi:hydrogenase maturation protease
VTSGTPGWTRGPLVIGYGNMLRRDDSVGLRAAELLRADPRFAGVRVLTSHQLTPELALDIGAASLVVFVDADASSLPGTVTVRAFAAGSPGRGDASTVAEAAGSPGPSSHHVGASELVSLAAALGGGSPRAFTVGIGVADLEMGEGLSPAVEAALPEVLDAVARIVGAPAD